MQLVSVSMFFLLAAHQPYKLFVSKPFAPISHGFTYSLQMYAVTLAKKTLCSNNILVRSLFVGIFLDFI